MADKLKDKLIKEGHPTKEVRGVVKLRAPDGKPSKAWKAWRAEKAKRRRPEGIE